MQAQSIEYIFENEDVMQGGIVWNAVPDYMFTTGLSMSLQNNFKLQIYPILPNSFLNICCCLLALANPLGAIYNSEKLEVAVAANF